VELSPKEFKVETNLRFKKVENTEEKRKKSELNFRE